MCGTERLGKVEQCKAMQGNSSERSAEVAHLLWEQVGAGSIPAAPTRFFMGP